MKNPFKKPLLVAGAVVASTLALPALPAVASQNDGLRVCGVDYVYRGEVQKDADKDLAVATSGKLTECTGTVEYDPDTKTATVTNLTNAAIASTNISIKFVGTNELVARSKALTIEGTLKEELSLSGAPDAKLNINLLRDGRFLRGVNAIRYAGPSATYAGATLRIKDLPIRVTQDTDEEFAAEVISLVQSSNDIYPGAPDPLRAKVIFDGTTSLDIDAVSTSDSGPSYGLKTTSGYQVEFRNSGDVKINANNPIQISAGKLVFGNSGVVDLHANDFSGATTSPLSFTTTYGSGKREKEVPEGFAGPAILENENQISEVSGDSTTPITEDKFTKISEKLKGYGTASTLRIGNPASAEQPRVLSVKVDPAEVSVKPGMQQAFTAAVDTEGGASTKVTWKLEGEPTSGDTVIGEDGTLTIGADEQNTNFKVVATSVADETKSASATVNVVRELTVTFDTAGGQPEIAPVVVNANDSVDEPIPGPTREGYTFKGWLKDGELYNFADPVTENITLTADWAEEANVTGVEVSGDENVNAGESAQFTAKVTAVGGANDDVTWTVVNAKAPDQPVAEGTKVDENGLLTVAIDETAETLKVIATSAFDDSQTGSAEINVVKAATVTFDTAGATQSIDPVKVISGASVAKPETELTKDGYKFVSWNNGDTEYDFSAPVTADLTLTAIWEKIDTETPGTDSGDEGTTKPVDGSDTTKPVDDNGTTKPVDGSDTTKPVDGTTPAPVPAETPKPAVPVTPVPNKPGNANPKGLPDTGASGLSIFEAIWFQLFG